MSTVKYSLLWLWLRCRPYWTNYITIWRNDIDHPTCEPTYDGGDVIASPVIVAGTVIIGVLGYPERLGYSGWMIFVSGAPIYSRRYSDPRPHNGGIGRYSFFGVFFRL